VAAAFNPPLTLVSPAPAGRNFDADGKSPWLDEFFGNCTDVVAECDPSLIKHVAFHDYRMDNPGMERRINGVYQRYGNRPIWLTEYAMGYQYSSTPTIAEQEKFMKDTLTMLENHPAIYRYVWFTARAPYSGWLGQHTLLVQDNPTPTLTRLGEIYKTWPEADSSPGLPEDLPGAEPPVKPPTKPPTKRPTPPPLADLPQDLQTPSSDFTIDLKNTICPDLEAKDKYEAPSAAACAALCESDAGCDVWQYCPQDPMSSTITSCKLYEGNWSMGNWARCYITTSTTSRGACKADTSKKWTGAARGDSERYSPASPTKKPTRAPTKRPTRSPTKAPVEGPPQDPVSPPPEDGVPPPPSPPAFSIVAQYDAYPGQTFWIVREADTGIRVFSVGKKKAKKFPAYKKFVKKGVALVAGKRYEIVIKDQDGIVDGYVQVRAVRDGDVIWSKTLSGTFRRMNKVDFLMPEL